MNWLIVKNDFKRNKVINLVLLLFMVFSSGLAVLSVIMGVQTFTSIAELYEQAQPPHFLQMHKGEINQTEIDEFMSGYDGITDWQTITMLNINGESITVVDKSHVYNLSDIRLDIGLVKQNESKDLLLNSNHEKVNLNEGEIGIPVLLQEMYGMEIGNHVVLSYNGLRKTFIIKEIVLDSQMNSPMVSSTRILLNHDDFEIVNGQMGEKEYLIEAYFADSKEASGFQTAYENAGLPQNGQAVTYAMVFLLSAITDITVVFILLLVSILLITVSFICVKFTIMADLEEEISEIGTMKAIGLPFEDIRDIYINKYRALALVGVVLGYIIALLTSGIFTNHISTTFGSIGMSPLTVILSLVVAFFTFLLINYYCSKVLKKIRKLSVVDALVRRTGFSKDKGHIKDGLHKSKKLPVNWVLAIREVFYKFKKWIIVFSVVLIAVLMILVPINLMNTFESPEFITYMGSSLEDILIEVVNGENLEANYENVIHVLENDDEIQEYYEYRRVRVQTTNADGELMNLNIDTGENSGNELKYLDGGAPKNDNEIAISYLNNNEIGKNVSDSITLFYGGLEKEFVVSGIYQDVTSGGYTAKSKNDFPELESEKYSFSVNLKDNTDVEMKANEWSEMIGPGASIDPMEEFIDQTLGGVVKQLKTIVTLIVIIGASLVMLITGLFLKMRLAKDLSEIAILKAIGFTGLDIKKQYLIKIGYISAIGIFGGVLLTDFLGEKIVNLVLSISGLGINRVELITNPLVQYGMVPLLLMIIILSTTWIILRQIKRYNIISIINE